MRNNFSSRFLIPIVILAVATLSCSISSGEPSTPEPSYRYDDLPEPSKESAAFSEYRAISQWGKLDLEYFFINGTEKLTDDEEREVVRQAFALWAQSTPLTFAETSNRTQADIVIGWGAGEHGDGDPFDGPGDVLAHASFPNPYEDSQVFLHFDDDERWVNSDSRNVDLLTVAAHEIGHTLGLAHSNDPNALMFPRYSGPHRFLGEDDVAGAQSLYGVASAPQPAPNVPANDAPPPSAGEDSDGDGIADRDEVLVTGTDPNNRDSDDDGLGDGIEVLNRMNPLDADMDRDGVSDGQEVANGTNPLFPEQADISPELEAEVSEFLSRAIELQIRAYRNNDASIASTIMTGVIFDTLASDINSLSQQGLVSISEIDYYKSFVSDIRVISEAQLEVDTCEVWTTATYRLADGQLIDSNGPTLLPQTITIQRLNAGWFITAVIFFEAPSFCS